MQIVRKQDLTFHVYCWRQFAWNVKSCFLGGKNKKNITNLSSAWLAQREVKVKDIEGWAQDYGNSNIFLKPLFRGNLDPFVNNANLGAIAHTSNGT